MVRGSAQSLAGRGKPTDAWISATDASGVDQTSDNDNRDSPSGDIEPWHSSAVDFDNIDDDIAREYENLDPWADDFALLVPASAPAHIPSASTDTHSVTPVASAYAIQSPPWSHSSLQSNHDAFLPSLSPLASLAMFGTDATTPGFAGNTDFTPQHQNQAWELIERPPTVQPPQQGSAGQQAQGGFLQSRSTPVGEHVSRHGLRFVPVDPLEPQALSRPQRRGPFQDRERQEETSRTRGLKACVRCRMQRIRVRRLASYLICLPSDTLAVLHR